MRLIPDWRHAWRLASVRVAAIGAVATTAAAAAPDTMLHIWEGLPDPIRALVPEHVGRWVGPALFTATLAARVLKRRGRAMRKGFKGIAGMTAAAVAMIAGTIAIEGGWVNHPADPGGETNKGITKRVAVARGYTGPMRTLPDEVAYSIYYNDYLVAPGYLPLVDIDAAVIEELFDTTVNMGPGRPSRWFQDEINAVCGTRLAADGRVGPATIAAFRACQGRLGAQRLCVTMLDRLDARQRAEYDRLVARNARLRVFHRGWVTHRIGNVDRAKCRARAA